MTTIELIKNIAKSEVLTTTELIEYSEQKVVSRTLAQNDYLTLTLFAFATGEGISSHASTGDAMIQILDGEAQITIGNEKFNVSSGQMIIMPANIPHAVDALKPFKMLLTVVKPPITGC
ncbi:MAG: cupin domain-containing protein [Pelovirga sp.]